MKSEQAYVDYAYTCLELARARALDLTSMVEVDRGGTNQARVERDAIWGTVAVRLGQLDTGDSALIFGRIDQETEFGGGTYYIGRVGLWDKDQEPVVVDWRAPVAESFYRATGPHPMGLQRRRYFVSRGREILALEDELFGDIDRFHRNSDLNLQGEGALIAALETSRTGRLQDIIGTIQREQDEIIRAPLPGVLSVQGGPGTGKTVVALHRAAYLLYTHRFPLEGQGVLVIGPNRLFLAYIEQVLPSLGESGVEMATLGDLVGGIRVEDRRDLEPVSRLKGDLRMVNFIARAVRTRQRPIRKDLRVGYGLKWLTITTDETRRIVAEARRRFRTHNAARKFVENEFFSVLAKSVTEHLDVTTVRDRLRGQLAIREALEWMWPVLTPSQLLNDLYGFHTLIRAADPDLTDEEVESLHRPKSVEVGNISWLASDAPLLDEAKSLLGPRPLHEEEDTVRTFGHIVVDEIQDLSPMELRMLKRRSLNGSMTVVGDIAQATGAWSHKNWESIIGHLPERRSHRKAELTIGYRIPAPILKVASSVLSEAAPGVNPPSSVRSDGESPRFVFLESNLLGLVELITEELEVIGTGNLAVIAATSQISQVEKILEKSNFEFGRPNRRGLDQQVAVVPVGLIKGLEVDAAIIMEPVRIIREQEQGVRALYVALTRATKRIAIVHSESLPEMLKI